MSDKSLQNEIVSKAGTASNVVALKEARDSRDFRVQNNNAVSLFSVGYEVNGKELIDDMSANIPAKGISVIMGPNGAGKSLMVRLIAGLIEPQKGSIQFSTQVAGKVALVFQKPILLRRSVRENLEHALKIYKVPNRERNERIHELLSIGGLKSLAEQPARALSGGEQQRIGLVRALASKPSLLLADEPTASLDPTSTRAIEALLAGAADSGVKVVLVTHDQGQAKRLGNDVMFLNKGTILEHSHAEDFFTQAVTAEAKAFLAGELLTS